MSVFSLQDRLGVFKYRYSGQLTVETIAGGVPINEKVAEGWIRTKMGLGNDEAIREQVAETMLELGMTAEEALKIVNEKKHLNAFKRDDKGLYIEGRQLKAALKEAASVALAAQGLEKRGWGATNKGLLAFFAEHVFVMESRLYLGVTEPTGVMERFVHTFRGDAIQNEEYVDGAVIDFTVWTDYLFKDSEWKEIWLRGEMQGIGASRSQGFGRYEVTRWDRTDA